MTSVKLVSITKTEDDFINEIKSPEMVEVLGLPEGLMVYTARVSSPTQDNPEYSKLLSYCIKNKHWSIFQMCDMMVELTTSRAIAQQILRHKFDFQEFSQRYSKVDESGVIIYEARRQDIKNRQNSIDDLDQATKQWFKDVQQEVWDQSYDLYNQAIERGIAKECARFLLPLNTKTKMYMKGSVRSWIHYLDLRSSNGTQKEHQEIAILIRDNIFKYKFPNIYKAMEW